MEKIILTGFQPFGNYEYNPTKDMVEYFNKDTLTGAERIMGLVLPCTYFGAFEVLSKVIDEEKPYAIISTGLSSSIPGIRIETRFQNLMNGKYKDSSGFKPKSMRINGNSLAPDFLIPIAKHYSLAEIINSEDIPVEISIDADSFICNSLGYLTTQKIIKEKLPTKNVFIHTPWTDNFKNLVELEPEKKFIKMNDLYSAIELVIEHI